MQKGKYQQYAMIEKTFCFLIDREEIKYKHAKTGGAPYVHRQYTKKASPKATKEDQKPRKAKVIQQNKPPNTFIKER